LDHDIPGMDMDSELPSIRLLEREREMIERPFTVIRYNDFMDEGLFSQLNAAFPAPDKRWQVIRGLDSKIFIESNDAGFDSVASAAPPWRQFIDTALDANFWREIGILIHPIMLRHKNAGLLTPQLPEDVAASIDRHEQFMEVLSEKTSPYLQFAQLGAGNLNSPHSDDWRKLVSMIVYFPPEGWREEYGGSTVFLRAKSDLSSRPWFDPTMNRIPLEASKAFFADMEPFQRSRYQGNTCVLFCKTINSFHAVEPIKCPPSMARRAFVMGLTLAES
jgi:hypothetical protein